MEKRLNDYLQPTAIIDSDHPAVIDYARAAAAKAPADPVSRAVALYYAVRDDIWYDPYLPFYRPEHYRASNILKKGRAFCVGKAGLLCAVARVWGIPARVGFADVRNHLATRQLIGFLGSDIFVFHGFTELYLADRWVKATPAFNVELCRRHRVIPLEFNGREDSVFQPYNTDKKLFMEYVNDHGSFVDIPVEKIVTAWKKVYGAQRVQCWIEEYEQARGNAGRDFGREEIL